MSDYQFKERRWTGSRYHNKYLKYIGIIILLYGLWDKLVNEDDWSTVIIGVLITFIGGYYPYTVVAILWVLGGLYYLTMPSEARTAGSLVLGAVIIVISLIVAATSKYVGEEYEDVFVKQKKPWE